MTGASLARWGFDPARLAFAGRTAATACVALAIAWAMGLEHPQWTAMTVWASAQPVRGMLVEKSLFRAAGTAIGVVAGVALLVLSGGDQRLLVLGIALWIAACAGLGNVLHGFVSYGAILAGYSAAMVALLEVGHPGHPLALGLDRLLTVLVGVAIGALSGLLFTPPEAEDAVQTALRGEAARLLRGMALRLHGNDLPTEQMHALLGAMAAIDEALDRHGAGSLRSRRAARRMRDLLGAQLAGFAWLGDPDADRPDPLAAEALDRAAAALETAAEPALTLAAIDAALARAQARPALRDALIELRATLGQRLSRAETMPPAPHLLLILHRDWVAGGRAALRAGVTLLLVGLAWQVSGWAEGPYLMLGTAVMISLFSTAENPVLTMRQVAIGQAFGVLGALACRWLAWPHAGTEAQLILMMMPFILLGALVVAHRRSMGGGMDFNMVMLLLLQPHLPLTGTVAGSVLTGIAVILAPVIALVAFRQLFPADPADRMRRLVGAMVHDVQGMAADAEAPGRRPLWRARLRHRLLRLVRLAERRGMRGVAMEGGMAALRVAAAITGLQARRTEPDLAPGTRRAILAALQRLRRVGADPQAASRALLAAARRLQASAPEEALRLRNAAAGLAAHPTFFRLGGSHGAA
ncbi:FUSC family protein [Roseomonas sp. HJA6]|uniref:FUSC family protein n=1 Tax=Roseomonas alba TaxID=2846776 RepID=A0ABS7AEP8_9PROT|nr:FUSC family protein [Neoroseomonas alba]MBW6400784.1 FUSC family protein [Neoroseomonas alba]